MFFAVRLVEIVNCKCEETIVEIDDVPVATPVVLQVDAVDLRSKRTFGYIVQNAPIAVAQSKKAINAGLQTDMDSAIAIEVKDFSDCFATEDQTYGMECFVNKVKEKEFKNK